MDTISKINPSVQANWDRLPDEIKTFTKTLNSDEVSHILIVASTEVRQGVSGQTLDRSARDRVKANIASHLYNPEHMSLNDQAFLNLTLKSMREDIQRDTAAPQGKER